MHCVPGAVRTATRASCPRLTGEVSVIRVNGSSRATAGGALDAAINAPSTRPAIRLRSNLFAIACLLLGGILFRC